MVAKPQTHRYNSYEQANSIKKCLYFQDNCSHFACFEKRNLVLETEFLPGFRAVTCVRVVHDNLLRMELEEVGRVDIFGNDDNIFMRKCRIGVVDY